MPPNRSIRDFFKSESPRDAHRSSTQSEPISRQEVPSRSTNAKFEPNGHTTSANDLTASGKILSDLVSQPSVTTQVIDARVIEGSDDEDEDSDSTIEDLAVILAAEKPISKISQSSRSKTPPQSSRYVKTSFNFPISPIAHHTRPKFDMDALLNHARKDEAAEASLRKVKEMMAPRKENKSIADAGKFDSKKTKLAQNALLESVVNTQDDGSMAKVTRALMRTEATIAEKRFYFFDTSPKFSRPSGTPLPKGAGIKGWNMEFKDVQTRQQSFISGFVEDMTDLGKRLPDELFSWILDEACLEPLEPLRKSYLDVLRGCPEQIHRLLVPEVFESLFQKLGATSNASDLKCKITPVQLLPNPYPNRNWSRLCSMIQFFGKLGNSLSKKSQVHLISTLLRMAVDKIVIENVDIFMEVQRSLFHLSRDIPDAEWNPSSTNICKSLFETVEQPSFRHHIVDIIPSFTSRLHDLRRRLAMCFFFDDLSYSLKPPHVVLDLARVLDRLETKDFDTHPQTDYAELAALVLLLDVAVDDGRSTEPDLKDPNVENIFNKNVDELVASIRQIMASIGNPGAAFISRIEAKEVLELVSQRIADTVRTKRLRKETWFDRNYDKDQDDLDSEKKGMTRFLATMKQVKKENLGGIVDEKS